MQYPQIKIFEIICLSSLTPYNISALRTLNLIPLACAAITLMAASCVSILDTSSGEPSSSQRQISFPVTVTREGQPIPDAAITKGGPGAETSNMVATMDQSIPFGVIGIDMESGSLLIDNESVYSSEGQYKGFFDAALWEIPATVSFSAYYPYVNNIVYSDDLESYSIPFTKAETEAGPLLSKTVQAAIDQLNMVPLEFQHITNDIGYKICDITVDPQLQGLIHLRKVVATRVASAGIFVNDLVAGEGFWHRRGYFRDVVIFEGDALVGVGMENEKFIGKTDLVERMVDSHRYYAIPDEIEMGKQCVEVTFDVDPFTIENFTYPALKDQHAHFMLYGILPDNVFVYGKQYTFHLGLDTGKLYQAITFDAAVSDWETKIYEDNDEF